MATVRARSLHVSAVLRQEERVTPLELFFDLVFVLAITQCTALMAHEPTWHGLAQGMLAYPSFEALDTVAAERRRP